MKVNEFWRLFLESKPDFRGEEKIRVQLLNCAIADFDFLVRIRKLNKSTYTIAKTLDCLEKLYDR